MTIHRPFTERIKRALTAGAILALASTGLSGCTIIQHVQGPQPNVPTTPASGDVDEALRPYYEQQLDWQNCGQNRECATAKAPMNWDDPSNGKEVELALVRIPAKGEKQGSLFTNPGGPGASGFDFVEGAGTAVFSKDLQESFDIVGWDPRGVGQSSAVECVDDKGMDEFFYGVPNPMPKNDAEWIKHEQEKAKKFADACKQNTGELLEFVDTMSTVRDLDMLRSALGDEKLFYFGFSYGTDIGAHYVDTYPDKVGRVVLDGATDPSLTQFEVVLGQQEGFANATRAYLEDCLKKGSKCPFTGNVDQAIKQINDAMKKADQTMPANKDGRKLTSTVMATAISFTMYSKMNWNALSEAFTAYLSQGDPAMFFELSDAYYGRDKDGKYDSNMFEAFIAINCADYPVERDPAKIREYNKKLREATPIGEPGPEELGDVQCEQWPFESKATPAPVKGEGAPPVLVVGTTGDPATPHRWAEAVSKQLESGVLLSFKGEGHIAYGGQSTCVDSAVDEYLIKGTPPQDGTTC